MRRGRRTCAGSLDFDFMSRDRQGRRPVHAGRLLLPHDDPAARRLAAVREVPAQRRRAREARPARRAHAGATTPSTGARACSSSAAARPGRAAALDGREGRPGVVLVDEDAARPRPALAGVEVLAPARALGIWEGGLVPVDAGSVALPLPRRADRRRDGRDRAAARLPGQRPRRRDAARRRAPARSATSRSSPASARSSSAPTTRRSRSPTSSREAGVEVAKVVDLRDARPRELAAQGGKGRVRRARRSTARSSTCDLLVASGGRQPAYSLLAQAGARVEYDDGARRLRADASFPPGVEAVGSVTGRGSARRSPPEPAYPGKGKCFVCVCEDVTTKDMKRAIAEGFDSIELAKRYTTVTMGPCQGKLCHLPSIRALRAGEPDRTSRRSARRRRGRRGRRSSSGSSPAASSTPARRRSIHWPPRGGGRDDPVGGAVEAPVCVRRAARGRGARGARVARRHRRLDAREAPRRRARRRPRSSSGCTRTASAT